MSLMGVNSFQNCLGSFALVKNRPLASLVVAFTLVGATYGAIAGKSFSNKKLSALEKCECTAVDASLGGAKGLTIGVVVSAVLSFFRK